MSFSDFKTISQVQIDYQIQYNELDFIQLPPVEIPAYFLQELEFNLTMLDAFSSEAARCELIILPVLKEAYKNFAAKLSLWIQKPIRYNEELNGTPDYIISKRSPLGKTVLDLPLLMLVEAKKNDFEQGWGQCLAELVTAQKINNNLNQILYGIVTDGKYWEFGQLSGNLFYKHNKSFVIDNITAVIGALTNILTLSEQQITTSMRL